ncbi:MAG: thiamine diphosphokinase [Candidatus Promineifilaceae bacterium]
MTTLVFANGDLETFEWVRPFLINTTLIIAADGGSRYLHSLNRVPDVTIGDLDSVSAEVKQWLTANGTRFVQFSAEKDETDLELALLYAIQQGSGPVLIFGASGGRLDQAMGNLLLLAHPQLIDHDVRLVEAHQQAWVAQNSVQIEGQIGDTLSLIPIGGDALIANTTNLKWPLQNSLLEWGYPRGISNVLTAPHATVKLAHGTLFCVHINKKWQR